MIQIFCVEDDASIRELLIYTLNASGFCAQGFESAHDFFEEVEKSLPQLILLDIMLPDTDGMEILKILKSKSRTAQIPVIMLTAKGDRLDKIKGLDSGADDYVTKPFDILELISRVRAVLRRSSQFSSQKNQLSCGKITIDTSSHKVYTDGTEVILTYKEYELLSILISNKGCVISRSLLLDKVWGIDFEGETRTLDVHIRSLRQKLGDSAKYIETVRNVGYRVSENV